MKADSLHLFLVLFCKLKAGKNPMGHSPMLWSGCVYTLHLEMSGGPEDTWAPRIPLWMDRCGQSGQTGVYNYRVAAGALITPNLPLPVFQLSMTNEHSGNSFRHTHNPLSWCQQQKLMTMWIAGRQKMHYNGQQNCYPLQEGGGVLN